MSSKAVNLARAVFITLVASIAGFILWMAYLEPTLHDVWHFHHYWETQSVPEYLGYMYNRFDARLGNLIAYFVCGELIVHLICAPLIVLGYLFGLFALAFGRLPRPSDLADSARVLLIFALVWIAIPYIGIMLFYRPFSTMYLHAFTVLVWLVIVPYRFALASGSPSRAVWRTPVMFLAGLVGGFSNEHVVPTAMLAIVACLWLMRRRGVRWAPWMISGLVGLTIGFLLLFFAPAQDLRYDGLATQSTIVGRVLERGVRGNLKILRELLGYARWMAALLVGAGVLYAVRVRGRLPAELRPHLAGAVVAFAAALSIYATMLASPLQGFRLMFASCSLLIVVAMILFDMLARDRVVRLVLSGLALVIIVWCYVKVAGIYLTTDREYHARRDAIVAAGPGAWPSLPAYTHWRPTKWFYGDDFRHDRRRRKLLRKYTTLHGATMVYPPTETR